jgi:hypothetical protein
LFTLRGEVHKSGIAPLMGFLDFNNKIQAKAVNMECLGRFVFTTVAGNDNVDIATVFNHLYDYSEANPKTDLNKVEMDVLMPVMVPEFDEDFFKTYHAEKVLMFYGIITNKLKEMKDEEPAEENKG